MVIGACEGMSRETHVPAWKRVGLKLKRKIDNEPGESSTNHNILRSTKKQKLKKTQPVPAKSSFDQIDSSRDGATQENDNELQASSTSNGAKINTTKTPDNVRERKSVTFSTGSKLEDGPSGEPDEQQPPDILDDQDSSVAKLQKLEKKKKRVKSAANAKKPVEPEQSKGERYLQYLDEYYDQRQQWKFNKNLQIKLLQNIFDVSRIPNSYDAKLSSYLSGLKGGARERLLEEAKMKREASKEEASAATSSIDHPDEEMGQDQAHGDDELQAQAAGSQQRAELIFTALSDLPNGDAISLQQNAAASANKNRGQQQRTKKRSRGKKRRTGFDTRRLLASDDDESSTSDSDSSNSRN